MRHLEQQLPLDRLEGLDLYDRARLLDEGVANIEGLAHDDLVDLLLETRIPAARLVDWVDQAVLYLHLVDSSVEHDEQGEGVRRRLRALGVRTATDLLQAAEKCAHRTSLIYAVKRSGDSNAMAASRLQLLIATMCDDEWMDYVRSWRTRAQVRDRRIRIGPTGGIESHTLRTPPGQHYECADIRPATATPTAPTTASPPPPAPPAGTDRS